MKINSRFQIAVLFVLVGLFSLKTAVAQSETVPVGQTEPVQEVVPEEPVEEPVQETKKEASWKDRILLKADFRYRVEMIKKDDGDLRYRHRIRARPALEAKVFDDLSATLGLGTGGAGGSAGDGDPVSNNQTLSHGFSSKFIWLDLAYFDYHPSWFKGLTIKGGKMKNPLYKVAKSELLWDADLNPEGFALGYKRKFGIVEPFLTGVSYFMEERKEDDDTWLLGAQAGLKLHFGNIYALVGGRYMDYTNVNDQTPIWDATDGFGNTLDASDADGDGEMDTFALTNDYNIVGGFLEVGGKIVKLPWAVFGDFATNTAVDDEKNAWLAGVLLGSTKEQWNFKVRYIYRQVQADSVYGLFTDSDFFGGNTGGKGHEVNVAIALHKQVQFGASYFFNQGPITEGADEFDYHRVQVDLKMKF